jgi:hypothetical protein
MAKEYDIRVRVTAEGIEVLDGAGRSLKKMEHAAVGVDNKLQRVSRTLESIGKKSMLVGAGIVAGVGAVAYAGIKYNASVEMMKRKLEIFLKTNERVGEAFKWAQEAVLGTPLMTAQMVENIVTLEQSGLAYKRWGTVVSDTAAALLGPGEDLNTVMLEFSQAIGRIAVGDTGMGIARLRELGIQVHETGIRFNKQGQAIDSTAVILEKLRTYMLKFTGSTEDLGKTFTGRIAAMKGQLIRLLGAGMEPAFDELNTQMERLIKWVRSEEGQKQLKEWAKSFGDMMASGAKLAAVLAKDILPAVKSLIDWFSRRSALTQWALLLAPTISGALLIATGRALHLAAALRMVSVVGPAATTALRGAGAAATGAAGGFGLLAGELALAIAAAYGLAKLGDYLMGKWGKTPAGEPFEQAKRWGRLEAGRVTHKGGWVRPELKKAAAPGGFAVATPGGAEMAAKVVKAGGVKPGMMPGVAPGWTGAAIAEFKGVGDGLFGGGLGGGATGGGTGGIGTRGARGITIYQTIEKVEIKAGNVDKSSFMGTMREVVKTELAS